MDSCEKNRNANKNNEESNIGNNSDKKAES